MARRSRHPGISGNENVVDAVAYHDTVAGVAAGALDGSEEMLGVRLSDRECISARYGVEVVGEVKLLDQAARQTFELVGANRQPAVGAL